jgi:hypothetical protein
MLTLKFFRKNEIQIFLRCRSSKYVLSHSIQQFFKNIGDRKGAENESLVGCGGFLSQFVFGFKLVLVVFFIAIGSYCSQVNSIIQIQI